jgi:hypothetical protein
MWILQIVRDPSAELRERIERLEGEVEALLRAEASGERRCSPRLRQSPDPTRG